MTCWEKVSPDSDSCNWRDTFSFAFASAYPAACCGMLPTTFAWVSLQARLFDQTLVQQAVVSLSHLASVAARALLSNCLERFCKPMTVMTVFRLMLVTGSDNSFDCCGCGGCGGSHCSNVCIGYRTSCRCDDFEAA